MYVYIVSDKIDIRTSTPKVMERVRSLKKLFPNAPKRIACKLCGGKFPNRFLQDGHLQSICGFCLSRVARPNKKKRKTRSDKGKKRKRT